jgi:hypothetical protein
MQNKLYKIDKGIKLTPVAVSHRATLPSAAALTLAKLDKGDSFLIRDELAALKASKVLRDFQKRERARKGSRAFTSRKVGTGTRIWRVR